MPLEYEASLLPSVPRAVCASLGVGTPVESEIEITAEPSKSTPIGLKYPATKRKANDSVETPEQPLTVRIKVFRIAFEVESLELKLPKRIMVRLVLTVSSPRFKGRGLKGLTWITTETCESVDEN